MPYKDPEKSRANARERCKRYRGKQKALGIARKKPSPEKTSENGKRYREKQAALGLKPKSMTEEQKKGLASICGNGVQKREQGITLPGDKWAAENPDRHRDNVRNWRNANLEIGREINRRTQAKRRSTPWGKINNSMWPIIHQSMFIANPTGGKYQTALGYKWPELRRHLESQFLAGMDWENWGTVWELDHIKPLSSFRYESLDDPRFREAWALSNLRPLWCEDNMRKGSKA